MASPLLVESQRDIFTRARRHRRRQQLIKFTIAAVLFAAISGAIFFAYDADQFGAGVLFAAALADIWLVSRL